MWQMLTNCSSNHAQSLHTSCEPNEAVMCCIASLDIIHSRQATPCPQPECLSKMWSALSLNGVDILVHAGHGDGISGNTTHLMVILTTLWLWPWSSAACLDKYLVISVSFSSSVTPTEHLPVSKWTVFTAGLMCLTNSVMSRQLNTVAVSLDMWGWTMTHSKPCSRWGGLERNMNITLSCINLHRHM